MVPRHRPLIAAPPQGGKSLGLERLNAHNWHGSCHGGEFLIDGEVHSGWQRWERALIPHVFLAIDCLLELTLALRYAETAWTTEVIGRTERLLKWVKRRPTAAATLRPMAQEPVAASPTGSLVATVTSVTVARTGTYPGALPSLEAACILEARSGRRPGIQRPIVTFHGSRPRSRLRPAL